MPNGALRHIGEFEVAIHLHTDVNVNLKLVIVAGEE
jgi:large subunit ribosomal protein L9